MSRWTTENAIFRDLAVAQGRVPVAIEGSLGVGEKPPSLNITEETEEEFYKYGCADAEEVTAPDCGHIMQMLDMVRDINVLSDDDDDGDGKLIVISKLKPQIAEFVPNMNATSTPLSLSPLKMKENDKALHQSSKTVKTNDITDRPLSRSSKDGKRYVNDNKPVTQSFENVKGNDDKNRPLSRSPKKLNDNEKIPKKRHRNIAVESILQSIADNKLSTEDTPEVMILLKPNDFIKLNDIANEEKLKNETKLVENDHSETISDHTNDQTKTVEVVRKTVDNITSNGLPPVKQHKSQFIKTKTESPFPKRTLKVTLEATNMFKRKSVTERVTERVQKVENSSSPRSGEHKPSELATEYYQKYIEQIKFKESVKDNIWTMAEKKMKELDEKRRRELAEAMSSPSTISEASDDTNQSTENITAQNTEAIPEETIKARIDRCLNMISLPQHRHKLTGDCIVCSVIKKKPEANLENGEETNE